MSGKNTISSGKEKKADLKPAFIRQPAPSTRVNGVCESSAQLLQSENRRIEGLFTEIISRLDRIEEKIDESVYPPESAIKPEFITKVKKAQAGIRKGKKKTYESMDAFIRAISE